MSEIVGIVSFAGEDRIVFTDAQQYLDTIREELDYMATTGFRFRTLTRDAAVHKAVDDMIYGLYGEENPYTSECYSRKYQYENEESEDNNLMNSYQEAMRIKAAYPPGTRIELENMDDPYAPVPPGTKGTVTSVDDMGQLLMKWDNGRSLAVIPGVDSFRKLTQEELAAEQDTLESAPVMRL